MMKRIAVIVLAFLMLLTLVLSTLGCKSEQSSDGTTESMSEVAGGDALFADLPQKNFAEDGIPTEMKILNQASEWALHKMTADEFSTGVDSAVFLRNTYIEEYLGVEIFEDVVDDVTNVNTMQTLQLSGTYAYDICYNFARQQNSLLQYSTYLPISDYEQYINLNKPWWYSDEREALTINGVCFMLAGDQHLMRNEAVWAVAFNRDTLINYEQDSPYDLIANNEWTFEKMYELGLNTWDETSVNENYAITSQPGFCVAIIVAADLHLVVKDEESGLARAEIDDYFLGVMDDTIKYFFEDNGIGKRNGIKTDYTSQSFLSGNFGPDKTYFDQATYFTNGKATFFANPIGDMRRAFTDTEVNYGFAPLPKYTSDQDQYCSYVYSPFEISEIPSMVTSIEGRLECIATVMEWLGAYSYKLLRPVYYENVLYGRLLKEPQAVETLDIILGFDERGKTVLELDNLFNLGMTVKLQTSLSDCKPSFNNAVRVIKELVDDNIKKTVDNYRVQP